MSIRDIDKVRSVADAIAPIRSGAVLLIGSFLGMGCPVTVVEALARSDLHDLTIVNTCTDSNLRNVCFTTRSSSDLNVITASRPPGTSTPAAL